MAFRIVNENSLIAVADAIRAKAGTSDALVFPDGFVAAVESIVAGGSVGDAIVNLFDPAALDGLLKNGLTVSVNPDTEMITIRGTATGNTSFRAQVVGVVSGETYQMRLFDR